MKNVTLKWISLAKYDLESAKVMLLSKRYLYVAFMCQQSIEKYLKAYLTETTDQPPPYTHNLTVLAEISKIEFSEEQYDTLALLTRHYINTRYPAVKENLSKLLNSKTASNLYNKTKKVVKCLKKELKI